MGDRYYNPTRGLFPSLDPEPGGNPTAYTYPLDPINQYDLDGHQETTFMLTPTTDEDDVLVRGTIIGESATPGNCSGRSINRKR